MKNILRMISWHMIATISACCALALGACQSDDVPEEIVDQTPPPLSKLFTLVVDTGVDLKAGYWVMIHDTEGKLLDDAQVKESGTTILEGANPADGKLQVTLFALDSISTYRQYWLQTYEGIAVGETWTIHPTTVGTFPPTQTVIPPKLGEFKVNYTLPEAGVALEFIGGNIFRLGSSAVSAGVKYRTIGLYQGYDDLFLSIEDKVGDVRYKFLENVKPNDLFEFTFDQMDKYDHVAKVTVPASVTVAVLTSAEDGDGKKFYTYDNARTTLPVGTSQPVITLGYIDRLMKWRTELFAQGPGFGLSILNEGGVLASMTLPEKAPVTVSNKTWSGYAQEVDGPFTKWSVRFSYLSDTQLSASVDWDIIGVEGSFKIGELPESFKKKYPLVAPGNLAYAFTQISTMSYSYFDEINFTFKGSPRPDVREIKTYTAY